MKIVCVLTKIGMKIKRMPGTAPSYNISLVQSTLFMFLSCRNAVLFASAVKNQTDQENERRDGRLRD